MLLLFSKQEHAQVEESKTIVSCLLLYAARKISLKDYKQKEKKKEKIEKPRKTKYKNRKIVRKRNTKILNKADVIQSKAEVREIISKIRDQRRFNPRHTNVRKEYAKNRFVLIFIFIRLNPFIPFYPTLNQAQLQPNKRPRDLY